MTVMTCPALNTLQVIRLAPHTPLAVSFVLQGVRAFDSSAVA